MRFALILTALAGGAGISSAASILTVYTSVNGGAFVPGNQPVLPGYVVRARYVCQTDLPAAVGLAGFSYNPLVSNWQAGDDQLAAWSTPSGSQDTTNPGVNGPGVRDHATGNGRLAPFGYFAATTLPTASVGAGELRILGAGTGGTIPIGQNAPEFSTNPNGSYFSGANPVPVFQFTFTVGNGHAAGTTMTIGADLPATVGRTQWWNDLMGTTAITDGVPRLDVGAVTIVPGPGVLACAGVGVVVSIGRRRGRA